MWLLPSFMRVASLTAALLCGVSLTVTARAASTSGDINITVTPPVSASCANGPQVVTDKSSYAAGEAISVTATCGSGNPADWVAIASNVSGQGPVDAPYTSSLAASAATSDTVTMPAPNVKADRDIQYNIVWFLNNGFNRATKSAPFTVVKSVNVAPPTATLPAALAADPFVPDHVLTVCASGCGFPDLGTAMASAFASHWDNVQIKISAGDYQFPGANLTPNYPHHLWIKGISADGHTYPHLWGFTSTSGSLLSNRNWYPDGSVTIDNMEVGPWNYWTIVPIDGQTWTLRNVYVRDTVEGLISGNSTDMTLNIYNSYFARSGGGNGPEHDIYVGDGGADVACGNAYPCSGTGGNHLNVVNSVFEQPIIGHAFKERARYGNVSCSIFMVNGDDFYRGSETMDMDSGQQTITNVLSVSSGGPTEHVTNNNNWDSVRYAVDEEVAMIPRVLTFNGSVFIADQIGGEHWFITLGDRLDSHQTWQNNKFVWAGSGRFPGTGGVLGTDATGAITSLHGGDPDDATLDGTNQFFNSRAAAGLPAVGTYPKGYRDYLPFMPAACTDPIGLVKIPTN